jgi:hypothetical protein
VARRRLARLPWAALSGRTMTPGDAARERFAAVVARDPIPLDEAALAIAAEEYLA